MSSAAARICLAAGLAIFTVATPTQAENVQLTARTGATALTGELLNFDGTTYRVATPYGIVTVNADAVDCEGPGCPGPDGFVSDWMISGASDSTRALIPRLIEAFAAEEDLGFVRQAEDATHELYVLIDVAAEREVARIRLRHTTAREGFADLVAETADMAMALRPPAADEQPLPPKGDNSIQVKKQRLAHLQLGLPLPLLRRTSGPQGQQTERERREIPARKCLRGVKLIGVI